MDEIKDFWKSRSICNLIIVVINIVVFIVLEWMGDTTSSEFMLQHGACDTMKVIQNGEYYRVFTSMFLHFGIEHLFSNMLVLVFLGDILEKNIGKVKYLIIYLGGGICGNLLSMWNELHISKFGVSAGASGAIFAVIGALLYIVMINKGRLGELPGNRLALMVALSLYQGFTSQGVDNFAHLGGLIFGFLFAILIYHKKEPRIWDS